MQDPFRPNSNAQLMREAQIGLIVVGLLLCVLVYVAFYRLTNRSSRFDEISRNVPVAEPIDSDPYQAKSVVKLEQKIDDRLEGNKTKPFAAIERFSSTLERNTVGTPRTSRDQIVAQATHMASPHKSSDFVAKPTFAAQSTESSTASGFVSIAKRDSAMPSSNEFLSNRSNRRSANKSNQTKLPKKLPKARPPVLKSEFGSASSQDFVPVAIGKDREFEIVNDASSFSPAASPSLRSEHSETLAPKVQQKTKEPKTKEPKPKPPKPKPPVPRKIDDMLMRQLPAASQPNQTSSFTPKFSPAQKRVEPQKDEFNQPQQTPLVVQTSAVEPFEPTAAAVLEPYEKPEKIRSKAGQTYTTRKGDSLWTIAQAVYGDGRYFRALHQFNQEALSLSESIPVGTPLTVPKAEELQRDYPDLCPNQHKNDRSHGSSGDSDAVRAPDRELDGRFYLTEDGDTLFEIARQRLGQASRYLEIYELNRFRIPGTANHLTPLGGGIELLLPK